MGILKRSDGVQFVTQAYRETFDVKKRSLALQEFRLAAEQHGEHVYCFKKDNGQCEVAFSKEPGYLFGETIWHHFGCPSHFIYCEGIANSAQILLVIVRHGSVYLDVKILSSELRAELMPLMAGDEAYDIVTIGEQPLRNDTIFGEATLTFPRKQVRSFKTLKEPLFPALDAVGFLQLQPLPMALKSIGFYSRQTPWLVTFLFTSTLLFAAWWYTAHQSTSPMPTAIAATAEFGGKKYQQLLNTPDPDRAIHDISETVTSLYLIPGWRVEHLSFSHAQYRVVLRPEGGVLSYLTRWARDRGYAVRLGHHHVVLTRRATLPKRQTGYTFISSQSLVASLVDAFNHLLRDRSVEVGLSVPRGDKHETSLTIFLHDLSPQVLDLIGKTLAELPVALHSARVSSKDGLLDGRIQLSVWGS